MPSSQYYQISKIMDVIVHLNPQTILDVGAGFGKYGVLCREYLDIWNSTQSYGQFQRQIDAIEVFERYITPIHQFTYNQLYVGNALHLIEKIEHTYELSLVIDVLEHFHKEEGRALLKILLSKSKFILISIPKDIGDQGQVFANQYEAHLASWTATELLSLAPGFRIPDTISHLVLLGPKDACSQLKPICAPSKLIALKRALKSILFD